MNLDQLVKQSKSLFEQWRVITSLRFKYTTAHEKKEQKNKPAPK